MQLTDSEIKEFQQIYYQTFGKKISRAEAIRTGMKLIRLLRILCEPISANEPKETYNADQRTTVQ